ncbi:phage tail fiber protein [Alcaligenes sp. Marseille-Q7550]
MAWYDTGTVNVTANSATVTGVGTQWLAGARRGEAFVAPDGRLYEVLNIASNTSLTLTKPYRGTTATGQQYALAPMQGYVKELADRAAQLLNEYGLATDAEAVARTSKTKALSPYGLDLNVQSSPNDATAGKLLAVGRSFGLGSTGALGSYDVWPSASLNDLNVPSGVYLLPPSIADRPPEIGSNNTVIWHRQAGTAGGQIVVWGYGQLIVRARTAGVYSAWREYLRVGEFGLGGSSSSPPAGRAGNNPTGFYYSTAPVSFGGGSFFFDMQYSSTRGGIRISAAPYSDDFYMHGWNTAGETWRDACKLWHSANTTVDSNGFIKRASPIVQLYADRIERSDHLEIQDAVLEHVGVGHYVLRNVPLLSRDGWYIETPRDRNGNIYFHMDYEEDPGERTLTITTTTPDYSTGRAEAGEPVDILEGRFISLRFAEDPSLYPDEPELDDETEEQPVA